MSPEFLGLSRVEFITVGAAGPPDRQEFYLQAQQGDLLVSLSIEEEHVAALSMGLYELLDQLGGVEEEREPLDMGLREPLEPLFRVGSVGLGYNEAEDAIVIIARALVDEGQAVPEVHLWCSRAQGYALAEHAIREVMENRPRCPLCDEPLEPGTRHDCIRGDGQRWLFRADEPYSG